MRATVHFLHFIHLQINDLLDMAASIGQCAEKQSPRGPDLQGKDLQAGSYPKHGSIQVETFPITLGDGSESVRGDNLPQVITPFSKKGLRNNGNGKSVS